MYILVLCSCNSSFLWNWELNEYALYSDEDTDFKALISRWLSTQEEDDREVLRGWIEDYFYRALEWYLKQVIYSAAHEYGAILSSIRFILMNYEHFKKWCLLYV